MAAALGCCAWCDKPAFGKIKQAGGDHPLPICLDHYIGLQGVENERQRNMSDQIRHQMAMANSALDQMDSITGMRLGGRIPIPEPTPVGNVNNISVSNSTIGVLSTAAVGQISAYVGHMPQGDAAGSALKRITSVVADAPMDEADRKDLLDQIATVAEQAASEPQKRKPSVIKAILGTIARAAATTTAVAETWDKVEPILKAHFGLR